MEALLPERKTPPQLKTLKEINLPEPEIAHLDNDIPVHVIDGGTQELTMLQFIFPAGKWYEEKKLVAHTTAKLLKEGTAHLSASQIANKIEFYGASLKTHAGADNAALTIHCLNKHVEYILPIAKELLTIATFPEQELETFVQNRTQQLLINQKRNDYIVKNKFAAALYGEEHPYGYGVKAEDYNRLTQKDLVHFYKKHFSGDNCKIILSGKVKGQPLQELNRHFGKKDWLKHEKFTLPEYSIAPAKNKTQQIKVPGSVQCAIRIGKRLFNKTHPDYAGMLVLNTILGGYFGSRLMSNIREEKGYTYGIYSVLSSYRQDGYFYIASDVGGEVCKSAVEEIFIEMKRLQDKPVPTDELEIVQNYLLGRLLAGVDGPFKTAEVIKGLLLYGLDIDFFKKLVYKINNVTAKELQELAQKHFNRESMYEVIAGGK